MSQPVQAQVARVSAPPRGSAFSRGYEISLEKTRRNIVRLADEPKSAALAADGNYGGWDEGFFDIGNWTSSFFTGMALFGFTTSGDLEFLRQVNRLSGHYRDKVFRHGMDTMHDLGFLYSLYSVALYRITGTLEHREVALKAADELAKRHSPPGGYIQAWGRMDDQRTEYAGLAIIDCMMNLPLLFWATRETGNPFHAQIATRHADVTMKTFVRADASVFHAYRFDVATGRALRGDNYCGREVESHWARGTAWAIYGFALAYGYTRQEAYLATSRRLAEKFIQLLDDEVVPVWDFRLPRGEAQLRDSSAAAVAACGLLELFKHSPQDNLFAETADALLSRLCDDDYLDADLRCPGVLKRGQVGDGIGRAKYAYTSWGDYFFMEALARKLHGATGWW